MSSRLIRYPKGYMAVPTAKAWRMMRSFDSKDTSLQMQLELLRSMLGRSDNSQIQSSTVTSSMSVHPMDERVLMELPTVDIRSLVAEERAWYRFQWQGLGLICGSGGQCFPQQHAHRGHLQ